MSTAERMQGHLIGQFQDKKVIAAILEALGEELDELQTVFTDLRDKRWIDTGEGKQLDGLGEIVGQSRQIAEALAIPYFGFEDQPGAMGFEQARFRDYDETWLESYNLADPEYRLVLWAKVAKNTAGGTAEDTISSLKFIFGAPYAFLQEVGNAKIAVGIGRRLTKGDTLLADAVDLTVRAGGVGVEWQTLFDYDAYFGFLGQQNAKGFEAGSFADSF